MSAEKRSVFAPLCRKLLHDFLPRRCGRKGSVPDLQTRCPGRIRHLFGLDTDRTKRVTILIGNGRSERLGISTQLFESQPRSSIWQIKSREQKVLSARLMLPVL